MASLAAGLRNPGFTGRMESARSPVGTFPLDHLPAALKEGVITRGTARARAASQGMSDSDSDESLEVRWGGCVRASSIACRAWQSIAAPGLSGSSRRRRPSATAGRRSSGMMMPTGRVCSDISSVATRDFLRARTHARACATCLTLAFLAAPALSGAPCRAGVLLRRVWTASRVHPVAPQGDPRAVQALAAGELRLHYKGQPATRAWQQCRRLPALPRMGGTAECKDGVLSLPEGAALRVPAEGA